jgi:simple sugar transport system ATP-binding protein
LHERVFAWMTLADERNLVATWVAGITKQYPAVVANSDVRPDGAARRDPRRAGRKRRGQVHADEDHLRLGQARRRAACTSTASRCIRNPQEARALGISMVFQHFQPVRHPHRGRERVAGLDKPHAGRGHRAHHRQGGEYGLDIDPLRPVHT